MEAGQIGALMPQVSWGPGEFLSHEFGRGEVRPIDQSWCKGDSECLAQPIRRGCISFHDKPDSLHAEVGGRE